MRTQESVDFDEMPALLLEIAAETTTCGVLGRIAGGLAARGPQVALARIWERRPGDICPTCPARAECPDQTECLHLVASAGASEVDATADWSRTDGRYRRFPIGVRKIGHVAQTREPLVVGDLDASATWITDVDWARREGIRAFVAQPMLHRGELLGVLAVFLRIPSRHETGPTWLRILADHAAASLVGARAFDEIECLRGRLAVENEYLRAEVAEANAFAGILGKSSAVQKCNEQVALVAPTDATVLILGESGTGKELVARAIHGRSARKDGPLIKVNCASIPRDLFESEFFGHEKGAFTGALAERRGRFELADGGTLFLDEVGEIPLELQGKLLRVLQEGTFERVGDERTRRAGVRLVAATNKNLQQEIEAGRFRQDLYYRLSVFPIELVPLRERGEDIVLLAEHFVEQAAKRLGCGRIALSRQHQRELLAYDWPGNVRELQNVIERAVIRSRSGRPLALDLPRREKAPPRPPRPPRPAPDDVQTYPELKERERRNVLAALEATGWKVSGQGGAAELLAINPTTLASKMKAMKIQRPR